MNLSMMSFQNTIIICQFQSQLDQIVVKRVRICQNRGTQRDQSNLLICRQCDASETKMELIAIFATLKELVIIGHDQSKQGIRPVPYCGLVSTMLHVLVACGLLENSQ